MGQRHVVLAETDGGTADGCRCSQVHGHGGASLDEPGEHRPDGGLVLGRGLLPTLFHAPVGGVVSLGRRCPAGQVHHGAVEVAHEREAYYQ